MLPLNIYVKNILTPILKQKNIYHSRIFFDWVEIVGARIARFSWPQRVSLDHTKQNFSILHLEVFNSSFATELKYLEEHLLEKIAVFFGYKFISQIKIKLNLKSLNINKQSKIPIILTPKQAELLAQNLVEIQDDALKDALQELSTFTLNKSVI